MEKLRKNVHDMILNSRPVESPLASPRKLPPLPDTVDVEVVDAPRSSRLEPVKDLLDQKSDKPVDAESSSKIPQKRQSPIGPMRPDSHLVILDSQLRNILKSVREDSQHSTSLSDRQKHVKIQGLPFEQKGAKLSDSGAPDQGHEQIPARRSLSPLVKKEVGRRTVAGSHSVPEGLKSIEGNIDEPPGGSQKDELPLRLQHRLLPDSLDVNGANLDDKDRMFVARDDGLMDFVGQDAGEEEGGKESLAKEIISQEEGAVGGIKGVRMRNDPPPSGGAVRFSIHFEDDVKSQTNALGEDFMTNAYVDDNATRAAPYTLASQWVVSSVSSGDEEEEGDKTKDVDKLDDDQASKLSQQNSNEKLKAECKPVTLVPAPRRSRVDRDITRRLSQPQVDAPLPIIDYSSRRLSQPVFPPIKIDPDITPTADQLPMFPMPLDGITSTTKLEQELRIVPIPAPRRSRDHSPAKNSNSNIISSPEADMKDTVEDIPGENMEQNQLHNGPIEDTTNGHVETTVRHASVDSVLSPTKREHASVDSVLSPTKREQSSVQLSMKHETEHSEKDSEHLEVDSPDIKINSGTPRESIFLIEQETPSKPSLHSRTLELFSDPEASPLPKQSREESAKEGSPNSSYLDTSLGKKSKSRIPVKHSSKSEDKPVENEAFSRTAQSRIPIRRNPGSQPGTSEPSEGSPKSAKKESMDSKLQRLLMKYEKRKHDTKVLKQSQFSKDSSYKEEKKKESLEKFSSSLKEDLDNRNLIITELNANSVEVASTPDSNNSDNNRNDQNKNVQNGSKNRNRSARVRSLDLSNSHELDSLSRHNSLDNAPSPRPLSQSYDDSSKRSGADTNSGGKTTDASHIPRPPPGIAPRHAVISAR
jgi:hypothetical protein